MANEIKLVIKDSSSTLETITTEPNDLNPPCLIEFLLDFQKKSNERLTKLLEDAGYDKTNTMQEESEVEEDEELSEDEGISVSPTKRKK